MAASVAIQAILLACVAITASERQSEDIGPLTVKVTASSSSVLLSDTADVIVTVLAPPHVEVVDFKVAPAENFQVVDVSRQGPDLISGEFGSYNAMLWTIRLEPLRLGDTSPGTATIRYQQPDMDEEFATIEFPTINVIASEEGSADPAKLRPIPPLDESSPGTFATLLWWLGVTLAVGALLGASVMGWRSWHASAPRRAALRSLSSLSKSDLLSMGQCREFVEQACQIVRQYLESAYGLRAPKQSTPQFLRDPATAERLTQDQKVMLEEFLTASDVDKFAADEPSEPECHRCVIRARAFLEGEAAK